MRLTLTSILICCFFSVCTFGSMATNSFADDWWSISDKQFFAEYKKLATGNQKERSIFAWMLFARVNQPAVDVDGDQFVAWELWATNPETFPQSGEPMWPDAKNRQEPAYLDKVTGAIPAGGGEEVTRNRVDFDYITDPKRPLWTVDALREVYNNKSVVNFPIGAVEIKANWTTADGQTDWGEPAPVQPDMYQSIEGIGLNGIHIMAKIADTPKEPYTSPDPSWFWTTFEYYGNPGREDVLRFITHPDALTPAEVEKLIGPAGLPAELAKNYRCNGTQITFIDNGVDVVLGNTTMEGGFGEPLSSQGKPTAPAKWTKWNASCHSCHGEANMNASGGRVPSPPRFLFAPIIGAIPPGLVNNTWPMDFSWPIPDQAVPRPGN